MKAFLVEALRAVLCLLAAGVGVLGLFILTEVSR